MPFPEKIPQLPDDPIFGLYATFQADPRPHKINLAIGIYQDEESHVPLLASVHQAEKEIAESGEPKIYLPIEGHSGLIKATLELIFGRSTKASLQAVQSVGGSGGLYVGGLFLRSQGFDTIFLSEPSWPNHAQIFKRAGFQVASYPYYDKRRQRFDFSGMCAALQQIPRGSLVLFHGCCHNPTGLDPSQDQWREVERLIQAKSHFPLFDLAYQGFGEGITEDAWPIRLFAENGHEMAVSSSFSKNFALYGERVGLLSLVAHEKKRADLIMSQLKPIIRSVYSNPPSHGARLVANILQTPSLRLQWEEEVAKMRKRLNRMRGSLIEQLKGGLPEPFFHSLPEQRGLFYLSGLNASQVAWLREEKGLYILEDGRLNLAGLHEDNVELVTPLLIAALKRTG